MKKKKLLAAALALLLTLSLAPLALAAELPFPADWFSGIGGFSLRNLIDENKDSIEIANSMFPLENVLFVECVVDEKTEPTRRTVSRSPRKSAWKRPGGSRSRRRMKSTPQTGIARRITSIWWASPKKWASLSLPSGTDRSGLST